ncbi:MAG: D-tyrosyl-tRNA(Tyr) deacylase [Dehalococcoidia bacterium]|nr:D-tyrosyl-tRNA(Tyr) deacylase [Dehalococcoidia bacterium]
MRALLQRVTRASVAIAGQPVAAIDAGLVLLIAVAATDTQADAAFLAEKIAGLRIFPDSAGRFDRSALDTGAHLLIVSQFTLLADTRKGRRPSFTDAAPPELAQPLFDHFVTLMRATGLRVETGRFQEHMLVEIHNDGPVTILLDSAGRPRLRASPLSQPTPSAPA